MSWVVIDPVLLQSIKFAIKQEPPTPPPQKKEISQTRCRRKKNNPFHLLSTILKNKHVISKMTTLRSRRPMPGDHEKSQKMEIGRTLEEIRDYVRKSRSRSRNGSFMTNRRALGRTLSRNLRPICASASGASARADTVILDDMHNRAEDIKVARRVPTERRWIFDWTDATSWYTTLILFGLCSFFPSSNFFLFFACLTRDRRSRGDSRCLKAIWMYIHSVGEIVEDGRAIWISWS